MKVLIQYPQLLKGFKKKKHNHDSYSKIPKCAKIHNSNSSDSVL